MDIQALFFDIDGTLVSFQTHRIPQSTVDALTEAKRRGVKVFIATGRPFLIINNLGQIEHLIDGYVTVNGAYCEAGGESILCKSMNEKDVRTIVDYGYEQDFPVIVVSEKQFVVVNDKPIVHDAFMRGLNVTGIDFSLTLADALQYPILQVTPFMTVEQQKALEPRLEDCTIGRWSPLFADITAAGADKGAGIAAMAGHFGIALERVMAFGDGGNDVCMLRRAGIGVAMGNADESVKSQADYATTTVDDDGVRNALRHFHVI